MGSGYHISTTGEFKGIDDRFFLFGGPHKKVDKKIKVAYDANRRTIIIYQPFRHFPPLDSSFTQMCDFSVEGLFAFLPPLTLIIYTSY